MLSHKGAGRHPKGGTVYYWSLAGAFVTASALAFLRWSHDYPLFLLGAGALIAATIGRQARRRRWRNWPLVHITGMGASYVLMLAALYVDNGKSLPIWRDLPGIAYWLAPSGRGADHRLGPGATPRSARAERPELSTSILVGNRPCPRARLVTSDSHYGGESENRARTGAGGDFGDRPVEGATRQPVAGGVGLWRLETEPVRTGEHFRPAGRSGLPAHHGGQLWRDRKGQSARVIYLDETSIEAMKGYGWTRFPPTYEQQCTMFDDLMNVGEAPPAAMFVDFVYMGQGGSTDGFDTLVGGVAEATKAAAWADRPGCVSDPLMKIACIVAAGGTPIVFAKPSPAEIEIFTDVQRRLDAVTVLTPPWSVNRPIRWSSATTSTRLWRRSVGCTVSTSRRPWRPIRPIACAAPTTVAWTCSAN